MSRAPYDSLNSSFAVGDLESAVRENLSRLAAAAGVEPSRVCSVKQVHGARVVEAKESTFDTEADGVWTDVPGTAVGVRTADCLPILIEDPRGRVAAVHAGWRGVIAEIVARTIELFVARGAAPGELRVAIGPCIQRCCFEVDGDLPERFVSAFGSEVLVQGDASRLAAPRSGAEAERPRSREKPHLDLPRAVQKTLERAGVTASHVVTLPQCTMCDPRFFSHRRDRGVTGRHLSFITLG